MIKYMQKGLLIIIILLLIIIIIERIPVKKALRIEDLKHLSNNTNSQEVIICIVPQSTGPNWAIIGDENGLFPPEQKQELIIVDGNTPLDKLNSSLFIHSKNMFVLIGETTGMSKYSEQDIEEYRVFKAENWYIVNPIDRGMSLRLFAPKGHISLLDYLF